MSVVARVRAHPQPLTIDEAKAVVAEYDALLDALSEAFQILGWYRQDHEDKAAEEGLPCVCDGCERYTAARNQYSKSLEPRPGYTALSELYQSKQVEAQRLRDALHEIAALPSGEGGGIGKAWVIADRALKSPALQAVQP